MDPKRRWLIVAAAAWDSAWKAAALWRAFGRRDFKWMPVLLTVNSLGLLPMAYIFFIAKDVEEA
jgi:hypothetical protein